MPKVEEIEDVEDIFSDDDTQEILTGYSQSVVLRSPMLTNK